MEMYYLSRTAKHIKSSLSVKVQRLARKKKMTKTVDPAMKVRLWKVTDPIFRATGKDANEHTCPPWAPFPAQALVIFMCYYNGTGSPQASTTMLWLGNE